MVIPSYNRVELLQRALTSVYAQSLTPDSVYLVIDEPEDFDRYAFLKTYDGSLRVTFTGGGFGGAKARNVGLDQVDTDYVFFLDDDDEWLPEKIEKQIHLLEGCPNAVAVTCQYWKGNDAGKELIARSEDLVNRCVRIWNYSGGFSCFGMRWNSELKELRLRDELASAQDYEFYLRVAQYGRIAVLDELQVMYLVHTGERISGNRLKKRKSYFQILEFNRELFSFREYYFNLAKIELRSAPYSESAGQVIYRHCKGALSLLLAMKEPGLSASLWATSFKGIILRAKRGLASA